MNADIDIYTATMAKIYADQGHFKRAAEIYRYLLEQEPGRQDLIQALSDIERESLFGEKKDPRELVSLFVKWFDLALCSNRLKTLRRIQRQLGGGS